MRKLISSKLTIFFSGFVLGLLVFSLYLYSTGNHSDNEYFKLKDDYCIDDVGQLKSGTLLQVDEGMSEGFTPLESRTEL